MNPSISLEEESEIQLPILRDHEIHVRPVVASVCKSEFLAVSSDLDGKSEFCGPASGWETDRGVILGHESSGIVHGVGNGVSRFKPGDRVTSDSLLPCWDCLTCREGSPNACLNAQLVGFQRDGCFTKSIILPERAATSLSPLIESVGESKGMDLGALAEPLACALHLLDEAKKAHPGLTQLIISGGGPIGAMVGLAARRENIETLIFEPDPARQKNLEALDLAWAHPVQDSANFRSSKLPACRVEIETSGKVDLKEKLRIAPPKATILLFARNSYQPSDVIEPMITKELTLRGVRGHVGFVEAAVHFLAQFPDDVAPLISRRFSGLEEIFNYLAAGHQTGDEMKVIGKI